MCREREPQNVLYVVIVSKNEQDSWLPGTNAQRTHARNVLTINDAAIKTEDKKDGGGGERHVRRWIFISKERGTYMQERALLNLILSTSSLCVHKSGLGSKRASLCKNCLEKVQSLLHPTKNSTFLPGFSGQAALLWFLNTKASSKLSLRTNAHQEA